MRPANRYFLLAIFEVSPEWNDYPFARLYFYRSSR